MTCLCSHEQHDDRTGRQARIHHMCVGGGLAVAASYICTAPLSQPAARYVPRADHATELMGRPHSEPSVSTCAPPSSYRSQL